MVRPACRQDERLLVDVVSFLNTFFKQNQSELDHQDLKWLLELLLNQVFLNKPVPHTTAVLNPLWSAFISLWSPRKNNKETYCTLIIKLVCPSASNEHRVVYLLGGAEINRTAEHYKYINVGLTLVTERRSSAVIAFISHTGEEWLYLLKVYSCLTSH